MRSFFFLLAVCGLLFASGCGKGQFAKSGGGSGGSTENIFRYPIPTSPTTLDPGAVEDGDTIDLLQQVFEGLVAYGPAEPGEENKIVGVLADRWDIEDGGKTYVFHIKRGVKFHNGRELTAEDFKFSIERACDKDFPTTTARTYLSDIIGVVDKVEGRADEVKGVQVIDPYTLKIEIDQPRPYFLGKLCYPVTFVVAKEAVTAGRKMNSVKEMIGTGPFKADQYTENQAFTLVANQDYHGGAPSIAKIERLIIKDAQTRLNVYRNGEIDLVTLQPQDVEAVRSDDKLKGDLNFFPRPSIFYVGMNQLAHPEFKNRDVRRAIAMAINRKRIVDDVLQGLVPRADSIVPPGVPGGGREDAAVLPFDPEQAKQLLSKAGYSGGKGFPRIDLEVRSEKNEWIMVAEAVASDLRQHLGLDVSVRKMEWTAYLDKLNRFQVGFFHMRWAADYLDPQNFLSFMLTTDADENRLGYSNPEFDRLCRQADSLMDMSERLKLYAQAEDVVLQDAVWVPIYYQVDAELIRPHVHNIKSNLFGHRPHNAVTLD